MSTGLIGAIFYLIIKFSYLIFHALSGLFYQGGTYITKTGPISTICHTIMLYSLHLYQHHIQVDTKVLYLNKALKDTYLLVNDKTGAIFHIMRLYNSTFMPLGKVIC